MSTRNADIHRKTGETDVHVSVGLDGMGVSEIDTGIGFFDHMLTLFASHGLFDLTVKCDGDIEVDGHHSVEDIGIAMGQAFHAALGEKRGIAIGEERGILTGIEKANLDNARNMLADNLAVERIARYTGLPLETVRKLKAELSTAQEKQ